MYRVWNFVTAHSVLLLLGAVIAMAWANLDPAGYSHVLNYPLAFNGWIGADIVAWTAAVGTEAASSWEYGDIDHVLTPRFLVNDLLMAFFLAFAGKEVWEAVALRNGEFRGRKATTPLVATLGGIAAPAALYLGIAALMGSDLLAAVSRGWAIPTASDVALSYVVGRAVFGAGHPALRFLLLLALADNAGAMIVLALFHASAALAPEWLLLALGAAGGVYLAFNWLPRRLDRGDQLRRRSTWVRRRLSFWPYLAAGAVSWFGFHEAGLHPALGLLPVVPAIPHADRAFGLFAEAEAFLTDLLNHIQHLLMRPVAVILFLFALANAGVAVGAAAAPTLLVALALVIGKPAGIFVAGWLAAGPLGLGLPDRMRGRDLLVVGCAAGCGFTLSLVLASAAFPEGPLQDAARLGTLLSLAAVPVTLLAARLCRIERQ